MRRREAVRCSQSRFEVSERRACKTLGQARSSQRYRPKVKDDEQRLTLRIFDQVREFPRYGYRMVTRLLSQVGWRVNFKRVYRIGKKEELKVPVKRAKKRRLGTGEGGIIRRRAEGANRVWSLDFIFDRTLNGRQLKVLSVIDEFTRKCIAPEMVSLKFW